MPARKILPKPRGAPWAQKNDLLPEAKISETQRAFRAFYDEMEHETVKMYGKEHVIKGRMTTAFSLRKKATYRYSGKTRDHRDANASPMGLAIQEIAKKAEAWLKEEHGVDQKFNTAIFTHYAAKEPGKTPAQSKNGLPFHDDLNRSNMVPNTAVVSFVLGEARPVLFRPKDDHDKTYAVQAGHGGAYVMLPGCQGTYQHCVTNGHEARDSVTLRTVQE